MANVAYAITEDMRPMSASSEDPIDLVAKRVMVFMGKVRTSQGQGLAVAASKAIENAAASAAELNRRNKSPVEQWASLLPEMTIPQINALIRLHDEPKEGLAIYVFQNLLQEESSPKKRKIVDETPKTTTTPKVERRTTIPMPSSAVWEWFDVIGVHAIGLDRAGWWFSLNAKDRKWASDKAGRKMKELRSALESERPFIIKKAIAELVQKRLAAKKKGDTTKGVHSDDWSEMVKSFDAASKPKPAKAKPQPKATDKHNGYSKGVKDAMSGFDNLLTEMNETCPYAYELLETIRSHLSGIEKTCSKIGG